MDYLQVQSNYHSNICQVALHNVVILVFFHTLINILTLAHINKNIKQTRISYHSTGNSFNMSVKKHSYYPKTSIQGKSQEVSFKVLLIRMLAIYTYQNRRERIKTLIVAHLLLLNIADELFPKNIQLPNWTPRRYIPQYPGKKNNQYSTKILY